MDNFKRGGNRQRGGHSGQIRSGNDNERLKVQSGKAVVIDQFMLGNRQFLDRLKMAGENPQGALEAVNDYGGAVIELGSADYGVFRDPREMCIIVHRPGDLEEFQSGESGALDSRSLREGSTPAGRVFVDTRCVALIDYGTLFDEEFVAEFAKLRDARADKEARDLVRNAGGAVRYGFSRERDELGIHMILGGTGVALWPDVNENVEIDEEAGAGDVAERPF